MLYYWFGMVYMYVYACMEAYTAVDNFTYIMLYNAYTDLWGGANIRTVPQGPKKWLFFHNDSAEKKNDSGSVVKTLPFLWLPVYIMCIRGVG